MKTKLLIIGILLSLGLTGTTFATHDPTYNHPTPIPEPSPETQEDLAKDNLREQELNARGIQTIGVGNEMGTKDDPPPPALCKSGPMPDGEGWVFIDCKWEQCGGTVIVDGICQVSTPSQTVSIFGNKGFITFLIILCVLIPVSIGLVVWRIRK